MGSEGLIWLIRDDSPLARVAKAETPAGKGNGVRNGSRGHEGMLLTALFSVAHLALFFYKSQDPTCPELVPPTVGLVHPHKSFIKKMPHRLPHGAI